jgi:GNAT superfamily N-acetyltransferase
MTHSLKIRTFALHEWEIYKQLRLRALAESPEAFGSTLAKEQDRTDAEWSNRLLESQDSDWNYPVVAEVNQEPGGLAWGRIEQDNPEQANLYQMWVAPEVRGLGAGQMLLQAVIAWARARNACCLELGVTVRDSPAMRLYTRAGFEPVGDPQQLRPGSEFFEQPMRLKLRESTG